MSIILELSALMENMSISVETGVFHDVAPKEYVVITPLVDTFELFGDNLPEYETQEARVSVYSKNSYSELKSKIIKALLAAEFTITARQYMGHEDNTGYHHYVIDTAKLYPI
jgi:hypothetical protein